MCGPDGIAIFDALHRRGTVTEAILYAFDLLELDGVDYRPLPLSRRKDRLARLLALWTRFRKSRAACTGEPMSGCANRRMLPTLKPTPRWRNRCPDLKNSLPTAALATPCRLAENASAGAGMARV